MKIIDRYLLRQFLQNFAICFLSLYGVYVVFDAFTNLEAFLRFASGFNLLKVMAQYYTLRSLYFFNLTSSLLVLMSAMFTMAWIQRFNEMTALMAAGISRLRVVTPVLIAAAFITILAAVNRETLIPRFMDELAQRPADLVGNVVEDLYPEFDNATDVVIGGKHAIVDQKRIANPDFLVPFHKPSLGEYGKQWIAENAYYHPPLGDHPGGYLLDNVVEPKGLAERKSLFLEGRPILITPHDRPDWLKPNQAFVATDVTVDELTGDQNLRRFGSTGQLIQSLRSHKSSYGADVRVMIHARILQPILDITLLFLGLPLIVGRDSRNVFVAIGLCMGLVTAFFIVTMTCQQIGTSLLVSPALASWMPLGLFVPAAVGLSHSLWEK
jgi:lipopolysaccharide export system permease protein